MLVGILIDLQWFIGLRMCPLDSLLAWTSLAKLLNLLGSELEGTLDN